MTKSVYGVYDSNAETIRAINTLKAKGYASDDITVVAKNEETMNLDNLNRTVDVNTVITEDDSFIDKIVRFFVDDDRNRLSERLANVGLSTREAEAYTEDLKDGKVLIIVEGSGNVNVGNTATQPYKDIATPGTATISPQEEADLREKNSIRSGVTNNPDPNIFPSTTSNALPQEEEHSVVTGNIAQRPIYDPQNDLVKDEELNDVSYAERSGGRFDGEQNDPSTAMFPPTRHDQDSSVKTKGESRQVNNASSDDLVKEADNLNSVGYAANSRGPFELDSQTTEKDLNAPTLRDEQMDEKGYGVISRNLNKNEEVTPRTKSPINNRRRD